MDRVSIPINERLLVLYSLSLSLSLGVYRIAITLSTVTPPPSLLFSSCVMGGANEGSHHPSYVLDHNLDMCINPKICNLGGVRENTRV
jgi:hypothetical protein